jgi:hypothetical protein
MSVSKIREMGYEVPDDITDDSMAEFNMERMQRNSYDDSNIPQVSNEGLDPRLGKCGFAKPIRWWISTVMGSQSEGKS